MEGGRLDEVGNVDEELQAEGKGIQPEDILAKARTAVSTWATAADLEAGERTERKGGEGGGGVGRRRRGRRQEHVESKTTDVRGMRGESEA